MEVSDLAANATTTANMVSLKTMIDAVAPSIAMVDIVITNTPN